MLNNNFLLKSGGYPVLDIMDGQLMVAFSAEKILYSTDFGVSWQNYRNIPFDTGVNPIVGGSIGFGWGGGGAPGLQIVTKDFVSRKSYLFTDGLLAAFSNTNNVYDVSRSRGSGGEPIFLDTNSSSDFGFASRYGYYQKTNAGGPVLYGSSMGSQNGTYTDWFVITGSKIMGGLGIENDTPRNFAFANGRVGIFTSYSNTDFYGYVINSTNNVYYIDLMAGTMTYKGNISGLNFGTASPLKSGFDFGSLYSNGVYNFTHIVASNIIAVSNNEGANWNTKITLSGHATEALTSSKGQHTVVSTNDGKLYVSNDYGSTFQLRHNDSSLSFTNVSMYKRNSTIKLDMKTFLDF